jgi:transposase
MSENPVLATERVDDLPLLLHLWDEMQVADQLDQHFPTHGNWRGPSLGQTCAIWLTFITSQADHCLNHVEGWSATHLQTLQIASANPQLRGLDFSDDRLASVLNYLGNEQRWQAFERELNQRLLRVYDLSVPTVRLDSTTIVSYGQVVDDGLVQRGHSKDHRPDLPQVKLMLASLDPLGLPLVTTVLPGQRADDQQYVPAIDQVRAGLKQHGLLYVGDSKMGALATRAYLAAGGDYYLCPLSETQYARATMAQQIALARAAGPLPTVRLSEDDDGAAVGEVIQLSRPLEAKLEQAVVSWQERVLLFHSWARAAQQGEQLAQRLSQAQTKVAALNEWHKGQRRYKEVAALQRKVEQILASYQVAELLVVEYTAGVEQAQVQVRVDEDKLAQTQALFGWQAYASNQVDSELSVAQALRVYRSEVQIEQQFSRLKGQSLGLGPMYLHDEDRLRGLVRLLSVALRGLALLEYQVRRRLAQSGEVMRGIYAGQAGRGTKRPTAERLLATFAEISMVVLLIGGVKSYHLTPLSTVQRRILALLGWDATVYERLAVDPATLLANERTLRPKLKVKS